MASSAGDSRKFSAHISAKSGIGLPGSRHYYRLFGDRIEAHGEAGDGRWPFGRALARHPDALRRRDGRRDDRPAAPRAVHAASRRLVRGGLRGAGAAARADGAAGLPQRAQGLERCRGRLPGDLHRPGPTVWVDPQAGLDRELALRRRLPGGGAGAGRCGATPLGGTARRIAGRDGGRSTRRSGAGSGGVRSRRAGGSAPATGEVPRGDRPLLLAGSDARAGRRPARRPAGHGAEPGGPGAGPVTPPSHPSRRDARRPGGGPGARCRPGILAAGDPQQLAEFDDQGRSRTSRRARVPPRRAPRRRPSASWSIPC